MKLIILLAVAALASGAKLDRTYLPPSYAQTSGGNGQFLEAPNSYPQDYQSNDFTHADASSFPNGNNYQAQANQYAQNGNGFAQNSGNFQIDESFGQDNNFEGFNNFDQRPERPQAGIERSAAILRQDNSNDGETYSYAYETSNGIAAEENGEAVDGVKARGGYSYTGDDGQVYSVRYTADENGFVPQGDHLPTPPPIPEEILKALEKNAEDEANGIYDDGSYSAGKYGDDQNGQQGDEAGYNYNKNDNRFNAGGDFNANIAFGASADDEDTVVTNNALLRSNDAAQSRFGNRNGIEKAYLPPFQQDAQRSQAPNGRYNQNNGFRNQVNSGFGGQNLQKTYLPPQQFASTQRSSIQSNGRYQNNGFRSQANGGFNGPNSIEKSYLPPQRNQETSNGQNGVTRAYLPPGQFGQRNQQFNRANGVNRANLSPGQFEQRNQNAAFRARFSPKTNGGSSNQPSIEEQRSYLPPQQQRLNSISNNREYLPPVDNRNRF